MHRALTLDAPRGIVLVHGGATITNEGLLALKSLLLLLPTSHFPRLSWKLGRHATPCATQMIARHLRLGLVGACSLATTHVRRRRGGSFCVYAP
jgi:hypothetical protein